MSNPVEDLTPEELAQLDTILARVGALPILDHLRSITSKADLLDAVEDLEDDV